MQSTLQIRPPVSSNPRYLQQRIKEPEQDLGNKRMGLFQSEARVGLEARLVRSSETPKTAVTTSLKQIDPDVVKELVEWLRSEGEFDGMSSARESYVQVN